MQMSTRSKRPAARGSWGFTRGHSSTQKLGPPRFRAPSSIRGPSFSPFYTPTHLRHSENDNDHSHNQTSSDGDFALIRKGTRGQMPKSHLGEHCRLTSSSRPLSSLQCSSCLHLSHRPAAAACVCLGVCLALEWSAHQCPNP